LDRDENAAINILKRGLSTVGHTGTFGLDPINAWGENTSTFSEAILSFASNLCEPRIPVSLARGVSKDTYSFDLVDYLGFLPTESLQKELGDCFGLLMTPRWVEAFGNVAIEALACGVPVVAYRRGGPVEIIEDGKTGFLVEPDSIEGLVTGIKNLDRIDRSFCRKIVEQKYSLEALANRAINWFEEIFARSQK
jgi:glycosyltransferase involved in cell wall biosynthesis